MNARCQQSPGIRFSSENQCILLSSAYWRVNHMPITTYMAATDLPMNKQLIFQIKLNDLHIIALQYVELLRLIYLFHIYAT